MQKLTREAVQELLTTEGPMPAVTMYIPMHDSAAPPHMTENQIRFKNLINQASEKIAGYAQGPALAKELHDTLDAIHGDLKFWESQTPGLLICARPGRIEMFHLPIDTDEYVSTDESFHLAPVLALLNEEQQFYVLTVAQHNPKLFIGDMYGLRPSGIELPASVNAALNIDEPNLKNENQGSTTGSSMYSSWFNGRGGGKDPHEEDRMKFFRQVDHIICNAKQHNVPLILAGTESETVEYRSISKYHKILEDTIKGNQDATHLQELFGMAKKIVNAELVAPMHEAVIEEYQRLEGANPDKVAGDMKSIQLATEQGRVDKLLTNMGRHTTDTIRDTLSSVIKITFPDAEHSKALNQLALKVWQMSGTIINLTANEMPHGAPVLARLRY